MARLCGGQQPWHAPLLSNNNPNPIPIPLLHAPLLGALPNALPGALSTDYPTLALLFVCLLHSPQQHYPIEIIHTHTHTSDVGRISSRPASHPKEASAPKRKRDVGPTRRVPTGEHCSIGSENEKKGPHWIKVRQLREKNIEDPVGSFGCLGVGVVLDKHRSRI